MSSDLGGEFPIDPEEFNRVFGFQGNGGRPTPGEQAGNTGSELGSPFAYGVVGDEETLRLPDPARLAELFDTLAAFNAAEQDEPRLGLDIVSGIKKGVLKKKYEAKGMAEQEAIDFIKATEGEHTPEAEVALLDLEVITLRYQDALESFGLSIAGDMLTGSRAEIANPARLTASLACISEHNLLPQVQQGLAEILKSFMGELESDVINNNGEQVDAYGAIPFWMKSDGYFPEPAAYARAVATLAHGQALAAQSERFGIDPQIVRTLRDISRYYQEGMIVEWALGHEMGFDENIYQSESRPRPLYQQDRDNRFWDTYFRMMDGAEAKSRPEDTFVADQRKAATLHITTYLGEILGHIRPPLTQEKFETAWPDRDALEMEIAKNMHDPYIARLVGWRNKLQQYGSQDEQQA